jgi:serine/threonine protein kinase
VRIIEPARRRVQSSDSLEQPASPIVADHSFPRSLPSTDDGEEPLAKKYGRHGDINPGNILWYDDTNAEVGTLKGTLKLADFGQAELNSLLSRTKPRSVANTMTYRPPECDLQPKIIRQSYDIWCLGCVYLEFVAWILGGEPLLLRFTLKRMTVDVFQNNQLTDTFFQIVRDPETHKPKVMIKQAVTHVRSRSLHGLNHTLMYYHQFIDELHRHTNCTDFLHEFLNIIQNNMLVIESADRASCEEIWRVLNDMHKKCRTNKVYATWQSPWCIEREPMPRSVGLEMSADAERIIEQNLPAHALQV